MNYLEIKNLLKDLKNKMDKCLEMNNEDINLTKNLFEVLTNLDKIRKSFVSLKVFQKKEIGIKMIELHNLIKPFTK